ncbi:pilus assembly protein TadG [Arthrobacter sp. NamB2]|uniref:pilus assembly protein TadG-related protein n=1 Tax=Arthrobacter sp. NamB2 TaxID=2576035 RepID=UPI0010C9E282|nr:Tad domain-containing protein [Arthrobacter sp. NamB2]TKV29509.1 pilus assembly protein TadG [Arthrobacter sp. NamB2]
MRRVRQGAIVRRPDHEQGAVSVLVALLMVVLLGFAALAVDVGLLYSEKAQLQNGADAGALAIAQKCATDLNHSECATTSPLARSLANSNALDARSNVADIVVDKTARKVTVTTGAMEQGGTPNRVSLIFANALGISSSEVTATSSAVWGSPTKGIAPFPLTFSICQVQGQVGGSLQLLQSHGSGANPSCNYGPSGATVPGGFGWLVQQSGQCGAFVDIAVQLGGSDTGNSGPSHCDAILNQWGADLAAGKPVTVLLPVFDQVAGTGSGAQYHLVYFAAYDLKGWAFSGNNSLPMTYNPTVTQGGVTRSCTGNCRGIIGTFIEYVSLADGYTLGPVTSGGVTVVRPSL